jgi:hypothetical protein
VLAYSLTERQAEQVIEMIVNQVISDFVKVQQSIDILKPSTTPSQTPGGNNFFNTRSEA